MKIWTISTRALFLAAEQVMPRSRRTWLRAMVCEAEFIPPSPARAHFAAGCLFGSLVCRGRDLAGSVDRQPGGIVIGAAVAAHALVPGSGETPLLWALPGGVLAMVHAQRTTSSASLLSLIGAAIRAGLVAGMLFLATILLLTAASGASIATDDIARLALGAVSILFLTTLGGLAAAPLFCRPARPVEGEEP